MKFGCFFHKKKRKREITQILVKRAISSKEVILLKIQIFNTNRWILVDDGFIPDVVVVETEEM